MTIIAYQCRLRSAVFLLLFFIISTLGGSLIFISYKSSMERQQWWSINRLQLVADRVDNQLTKTYFLSARSFSEHDMLINHVLPLIFDDFKSKGVLKSDTQIILLDPQFNLLDSNHSLRELSPTSYQPRVNINQFQRGELSLFSRLLLLKPELLQTGTVDWQDARWQVHLHRMTLGENKEYWIGVAEPLSELMTDVYRNMSIQIIVMLITTAISYLLAWWLSGRIANSFVQLTQQSQFIRRFQLKDQFPRINSCLFEVNELGESIHTLQFTLAHFMSLIGELCKTRDLDLLANALTAVIRKLYGGDGALLWLPDNKDATRYKTMVSQGRGNSIPLVINLSSEGQSDPRSFEESVWPWFTQQNLTATHIELIELKDRFDENMGWICIYFSQAPNIDNSVRALVESYLQFATLALESQRMQLQRKELFDSLIEMVASAIDAKSKYTGGHCQRVPELALALAQEACDSTEGEFADFQLSNDEWEALQIAAWMHDCGKVTTPEAIVDKATKLETVYNRIHEVRTRFELLKRDKKIESLQRQLVGESKLELDHWLEQEWQRLDAEFAFVAECNLGQQRMGVAERVRLDRIATQTWWRTLDDSLGLAHEELDRKRRVELPAIEFLLADKEEHLIPHDGEYSLEQDQLIGVKRDIPAYKLNRGERYNLNVVLGTLTEEDRFKINDHIVQTIRMLKQLPYPKHLKSVPDIAGAHHERLDGNGYPRQLSADQIPITARILTIADIFEALTAADRPYKKAKPLDEALSIMQQMAQSGHIDPELFALFLSSGVYIAYAQAYLPTDHPDNVDVRQKTAAR
jgi:HD-GYP domain-containing protein (c-di-GMP phosphodiesterase class II)